VHVGGMSERIRGVIFDVDGTLVNSNDAHARAWVQALDEAGVRVTFAEVRPLIGMGGDKLLPKLAGVDEESELGQRASRRRAEIFAQQYLPELRAFPQTRALLLRLRDTGRKLGVASSAKQEELQALLERAQVSDLVESATSSTDAARSKPDPDIVRAALDRLELAPERAVMIGDTPYDIEAASRLGVPTLAFRSGGRSDQDLARAAAIYDDAADLLARFDDSILARARAT
jgi:HAD superfamily hydrolase (TIGR01509 family)